MHTDKCPHFDLWSTPMTPSFDYDNAVFHIICHLEPLQSHMTHDR